jgi:hypothetical protein
MTLSARPRWLILVVDPTHPEWVFHRQERYWTFDGARRRAEGLKACFDVYIIDRFTFGEIVWRRYADEKPTGA